MRVIIDVEKVVVKDRIREDYGDLEDLKKSILKYSSAIPGTGGLLQPIGVDSSMSLIWGGRRLRAYQELGLTKVPALMVGGPDVTPALIAEMEFDENIQRKNLKEGEISNHRTKMHALLTSIHGEVNHPGKGSEGQSLAKSAEAMGIAKSTLFQDKLVSHALAVMPELSLLDKKSAIINKFKRELIKKITGQIALLVNTEVVNSIRQGDCRELIKEVPDESVGMVLTDIPYDLDVSKLSFTSWSNYDSDHPNYRESGIHADTYFESGIKMGEGLTIMEELIPELHRVLIQGGHCYVFCGFAQTAPLMEALIRRGFKVRPVPLVWDKTNAFNPNAGKQIPFCWEPIVFASKGTARDFTGVITDDVLECPIITKEKNHINSKPISLAQRIVLMSSFKGEVVMDPFCGGGNLLRGAIDMERRVIGYDEVEASVLATKANLALSTLGDLNLEDKDDGREDIEGTGDSETGGGDGEGDDEDELGDDSHGEE